MEKNIKMLVCDFDGVFTDGGVYIGEGGRTFKKINFADVMGLHHFLKSGYKFALISGEESPAVNYLKEKLNIQEIHQNIRDKSAVMRGIMEKYNLSPDEVIYAGDDINDIQVMKMVKYAVAPSNANYKVKKMKNLQISKKTGSQGFVREITDVFLK